jgi:hypothetical protein
VDEITDLLDAADANVQIYISTMHTRFPARIFGVPPLSPAAGQVLTTAFSTGEIRHFLESVLKDSDAASTCARRSFPHPLGFFKVVLANYQNGGKLRLHVWPEGKECGIEQDIHDHFWDFCSIVLEGELEFIDFVPAAIGTDYFHYRLYPTAPSAYNQVYLGHSALSPQTIHRLRVGDCISVSRTTLHQAYPTTSGLCATLLLQGPQQSACNNIHSSTYEIDASKIVSEQPLGEAQLRELLESVVAALPNNPVS